MPLPKKRKESKKPFVVGFVVTVVVLFSLAFGLLFYSPPLTVTHISGPIPEYNPMWAKYVPGSAIQFGFENYTAIRAYNSSYPTQYTILLNIIDLNVSLPKTNINSVLSVTLTKPNESVAFAFVNGAAWNNFTSAAEKTKYAATYVGNDSLFYVRNAERGTFQYGWLALVPADHAVAFALGDAQAKAALQIVLQTTQADSLLSKQSVRTMLYLVNGTDHLAVGNQGFPGVISQANSTLTVVDDTGSQVLIRRVLAFGSTDTAVSQYNTVRQNYLNSRIFGVYDSFVKATEYEAQNDLVGAIRLVE